MPVSHFTSYYYFKKSKNDNSRQLVIYLYIRQHGRQNIQKIERRKQKHKSTQSNTKQHSQYNAYYVVY